MAVCVCGGWVAERMRVAWLGDEVCRRGPFYMFCDSVRSCPLPFASLCIASVLVSGCGLLVVKSEWQTLNGGDLVDSGFAARVIGLERQQRPRDAACQGGREPGCALVSVCVDKWPNHGPPSGPEKANGMRGMARSSSVRCFPEHDAHRAAEERTPL